MHSLTPSSLTTQSLLYVIRPKPVIDRLLENIEQRSQSSPLSETSMREYLKVLTPC